MDEINWLSCCDPHKLLAYVRRGRDSRAPRTMHLKSHLSGSRLRLLGCGLIRPAGILDPEWTQLVEAIEVAHGECSREVQKAIKGHRVQGDWRWTEEWRWILLRHVARADLTGPFEELLRIRLPQASARQAARCLHAERRTVSREFTDAVEDAWSAESSRQVQVIRDVVGTPFRAGPIRNWLVQTRHKLAPIAQAIYDQASFRDMPILGDALIETNCPDPRMIEHCQASQMHVRGCWVIDALTGAS